MLNGNHLHLCYIKTLNRRTESITLQHCIEDANMVIMMPVRTLKSNTLKSPSVT